MFRSAVALLSACLLALPAVAQRPGGGGGGIGGGGGGIGGGGGGRPGGGGIGGGGIGGGGIGGRPGGGFNPNPGGGFNPGGSGGGFNPGGGGFNPGGSGGRPTGPVAIGGGSRPGGSSGFAPGVPSGPQYQPPASTLSVTNPFASSRSYIVPSGTAIQVPNPNLPKFGGGAAPEFATARNHASAGNTAGLNSFITTHRQANANNLTGMFSAVNALHGVSNAEYTQLRTDTYALARREIAQGANQPMPYVVMAQMSLQDRNSQQFADATRTLMQKFPNSEYAHFYQGVQHLENRDFAAAEAALKKARELGMPEDSIADLLRTAIDNQKWIWEYAAGLSAVVVLWLIGLLGLFVVGKWLSRRTLADLHRSEEGEVERDRFRRRLYRRVIALAGVYYYVSLPILLFVSLTLPLAMGYALLLVPFLNLLLVAAALIVGLGGVITAISGIRTAFLRVRPFEAGRVVTEDELPEIWDLAREVAAEVGTRPVDEIRLIPSADVCVLERGSWWARRRDRGERVLILGVGALHGMKLDALRAILAHEYGHFHNRDTAGGDIALRVYRSMNNFAAAIVKRGKVRWWDLSVHFLRLYHALFRRLTFGASRLQEVYADRLAVRHYGAAAFREGLTQVIRRSVELDVSLNRSMDTLLKTGRPVTAFFNHTPVLELHEVEQVETVVGEVLNRPTDQHDSHPSPKDRFALAERLDPDPDPVAEEYVWGLLAWNPDVIDDLNRTLEEALAADAEPLRAGIADGVKTITTYLRHRPSDPVARFERARLYLATGRYDDAIDDLDKLIEDHPRDGGAWYLRALARKRMGDFARAIPELELLVASAFKVTVRETNSLKFDVQMKESGFTTDDQLAFLLTLADCQVKADQPAAAERTFTRALEVRKASLPALLGRGKVRAELGKRDLALRDFKAAMREWPGSPDPAAEYERLTQAA